MSSSIGGSTDAVVAQDAGIWLAQRDEFDRFDVRSLRPPLETFLGDDLQPLLARPAEEARWHVYYRCEWCEYFQHCREEMRERDDVSRVPYLSTHAKRYLSELDPPVTTVPEFSELLADEARAGSVEECASLRGRKQRLARQIEALTSGQVETFGGYSAAMPRAEHVRVVVTLQSEPVSGQIYCYGIYAQGVRDVLGESPVLATRVANEGSAETIEELERALCTTCTGFFALFTTTTPREWTNGRAQKTLQGYVFDGYERSLLVDLLGATDRRPPGGRAGARAPLPLSAGGVAGGAGSPGPRRVVSRRGPDAGAAVVLRVAGGGDVRVRGCHAGAGADRGRVRLPRL